MSKGELDDLVTAGPPVEDPVTAIQSWLNETEVSEVALANDAFERFDEEGVVTLVEALARRGCQVVYLTDDPEILSWAIGLPDGCGGASTMTGAHAPRRALVRS